MLGMNDTSHATTVHYFISKYDLPGVTFCHGLKDFKILLKSKLLILITAHFPPNSVVMEKRKHLRD